MKKMAARASAGSDYGYREPFFEAPGDGGGAVIDQDGNRDTSRQVLAGEARKADPVRPTEKYLADVAEISKIAATVTDAATRVELATAKMEELRKESAKMRAQDGMHSRAALGRGWRTTEEVLTDGAALTPEEQMFREANDKIMLRAIRRGWIVPQIRMNDKGDDAVLFQRTVPDEAFNEIPEIKAARRLKDHITLANDIYDNSTSGAGGDWVPTMMSGELWDYYRIRGDFLAALPTMNIPRGTGAYDLPTLTAEDQARIVAANTSVASAMVNTSNAFTNTTAKTTLNPKKHFIIKQFDVEAEEDWAIEALSYGRRAVQQILVAAVEQAVINGQAASSATLDDAPAVSGLYSADGWDQGDELNSLRLYTVDQSNSTSIGGAVTAADILAARKSMGKYGARPGELLYITSPSGYLGMLADTNVLTVEKYGSGATVLSGELARVGGVRIMMSDQFPENIAASGIDAGTGATTGGVLFNLSQWMLGIKRQMTLTMLPQPGYDIMNVIGSVRSHFVIREDGSNAAWYLYNVS